MITVTLRLRVIIWLIHRVPFQTVAVTYFHTTFPGELCQELGAYRWLQSHSVRNETEGATCQLNAGGEHIRGNCFGVKCGCFFFFFLPSQLYCAGVSRPATRAVLKRNK